MAANVTIRSAWTIRISGEEAEEWTREESKENRSSADRAPRGRSEGASARPFLRHPPSMVARLIQVTAKRVQQPTEEGSVDLVSDGRGAA